MARCKICKVNIPDGIEYCEDCQDKRSKVSSESYLDSLLNSVKTTTPSAESIYKKKRVANSSGENQSSRQLVQDKLDDINNIEKLHSPETADDDQTAAGWQDYMSYPIDLSDLEEFDNYDLGDDLRDIEIGNIFSDEELFGEGISQLLYGHEEVAVKKSGADGTEEMAKAAEAMSELMTEPGAMPEVVAESGEIPELMAGSGELPEVIAEPETPADKAFGEPAYDSRPIPQESALEESIEDQELQSDLADMLAGTFYDGAAAGEPDQRSEDNQLLEELPELEAEDFDPDLNDLLDSLNIDPDDYTMDQGGQAEDMEPKLQGLKPQELEIREEAEEDDSEALEVLGQTEAEEDDFLSLLKQIDSDDPVSEDVRAINDLLQGKPVEPPRKDSMPGDVGEVFSDALKGISSLSDLEAREEEVLGKIPDKKGKKAKKEKKSKKNEEADGEKPKKSLLQLLFGNVKSGKAPKKAAVSEEGAEKADGSAEAPPQKGKAKKAKGKAGEGSEETGAGKKARKGKKGAASEEEGEGGKEKAAKVKKEKKQKKKTEIIQVIDEIEEDEGRINRLGATIVFIFFGLLATLVLVGTNMVSYTLSIEKATSYFDRQKYTEAYNEVYGMEIKDEDIAIYDKIMTVMYVNKQLNSYNNYYSVKDYPKALDSLLKGLRRYDKYIELATLLGIESDLKYVREQILAELKKEFKLSEKQAMKIISYDNMEKYSLAVYNVVDNNMNN